MGKLLSVGTIKYKGETISYKWYRDGRLPHGRGYQHKIEAYYDGRIVEYDHGYGLDHAISLLKMEIESRKSRRKAKTET